MKKLIVVCLFVPSFAFAEFKTGNSLLDHMQSTSVMSNSLALGYVQGVADAHHGVTYCPPENVTAGQVYDMVKKVLEELPSIRNLTADAIVQAVLAQSWACKDKPKSKKI